MTIKTFTTDKAVYTIELHHQRRVDRFEDGVAIWEDIVQYNIMLDGKMVRFCYDEADIEEMIRIEENGHGINPAYLTGVTAG
jgi:hypothetical protein